MMRSCAGAGQRHKCQAAITPVAADLAREPRVQGEAAPREGGERTPSHQSTARKPPDLPDAARQGRSARKRSPRRRGGRGSRRSRRRSRRRRKSAHALTGRVFHSIERPESSPVGRRSAQGKPSWSNRCWRSTAIRSRTALITACRNRSGGRAAWAAARSSALRTFCCGSTKEQPRAVLVGWDTLDAPTYRHRALALYPERARLRPRAHRPAGDPAAIRRRLRLCLCQGGRV